jgi:glycosyltransferase involved in cell wall biosynthesis
VRTTGIKTHRMTSDNHESVLPTPQPPAAMTAEGAEETYSLPVRWRKRLSRLVGTIYRRAILENLRYQIRVRWPGVRGLEFVALAALLVLLRAHHRVFDAVCWYARRARRREVPDVPNAEPGTVLHVTGSFDLGGTQTQIKNLCTSTSSRFAHQAVETFPELNYLYRQGVVIDRSRYSGKGPWRRALGRLVDDSGTRSYRAIQVWKFYKDFRHHRPNIVVGWGHEMSVIMFAAAAFARVPHIVFCIRTVSPDYGWTSDEWGRWMQQAHRDMLPMVSGVIVNSTLLQANHAQWVGMDPKAIAVCHNGMSLDHLDASAAARARTSIRARYGIADDAVVITNVGRFSGEKGQASLVDANQHLRRAPRGSLPAFVWLLCGDGPTLDGVRAAAESHGATNLIFAGRTTEVREVLSASDIFVMPSDFEGMPNAMMEAMVAGLPCVSTRISGATDVARDSHEALYYEAGDAAALASHLTWLMTNPGEARRLGNAAAQRIQEFSVDHAVARFDAVLASLAPPTDAPAA